MVQDVAAAEDEDVPAAPKSARANIQRAAVDGYTTIRIALGAFIAIFGAVVVAWPRDNDYSLDTFYNIERRVNPWGFVTGLGLAILSHLLPGSAAFLDIHPLQKPWWHTLCGMVFWLLFGGTFSRLVGMAEDGSNSCRQLEPWDCGKPQQCDCSAGVGQQWNWLGIEAIIYVMVFAMMYATHVKVATSSFGTAVLAWPQHRRTDATVELQTESDSADTV